MLLAVRWIRIGPDGQSRLRSAVPTPKTWNHRMVWRRSTRLNSLGYGRRIKIIHTMVRQIKVCPDRQSRLTWVIQFRMALTKVYAGKLTRAAGSRLRETTHNGTADEIRRRVSWRFAPPNSPANRESFSSTKFHKSDCPDKFGRITKVAHFQ